jgi:hypothetical protein
VRPYFAHSKVFVTAISFFLCRAWIHSRAHLFGFAVRLLFAVRHMSSLTCTQHCRAFFSFFAVRCLFAVRVFVVGRKRLLCRARDTRQWLVARQRIFSFLNKVVRKSLDHRRERR